MKDKNYLKKLAYHITNQLEFEQMLNKDVKILVIEDAIKRMINEFIEKEEQPPENRYYSKGVHWTGSDGLAHCHTLAKNLRLTDIPDFVTCRRCIPEAMTKKAGKIQ